MSVSRGGKSDDERWGSRIPGENIVNRELTMGSHSVGLGNKQRIHSKGKEQSQTR